jgi:hypothetical protein
MFVVEAWKHVDAELKHTPNAPGQLPVNIPAALEKLCLGMRRSNRPPAAGKRFFTASEVSNSPLAPHLDLQMQLPPQQLLQLLKEAGRLLPLQQQQDAEAASWQARDADEAVQQQQQAGSLPFDVSSLHPDCQECIAELLSDWRLAIHYTARTSSSSGGGGGNGSREEKENKSSMGRIDWLFEKLQAQCSLLLESMQGLQMQSAPGMQQQEQQPGNCAVAAQCEGQQTMNGEPGQQQQQQPAKHQHSNHTAAQDTAKQQQQRKQHGVNGSLVKISSVLTDSDDDTSSTSSSGSSSTSGSSRASSSSVEVNDLSICSSSQHSIESDEAGLQEGEAWVDPSALAQDFVTLSKCLLRSFIEQAWESGGGAAAAAWQQAVPLQVLLLCGQVQQLEAALERWAQSAKGLLQMQMQQHHHHQHALIEEHKQQQLQLLQHVAAVVQSLRQFRHVTEAINSTADAAAAAPASPAAGALQAGSSSNTVQRLAPASFFSAAGPLAGGLWGFSEPAGAGLWAPVDNAGMAAAAAGRQQQQQQQEQESLLPLLQQQAWAFLLGSCAWQDAQMLAYRDVSETIREAPTEVMDGAFQQMHTLRRSGWHRKAAAEQRRSAAAYIDQFEELGCSEEMLGAVRNVFLVAPAAAEQLAEMQLHAFEELGFDGTAWISRKERAEADALVRREHMLNARLDAQAQRLQRQLRARGDPHGLGIAQFFDTIEETRILKREMGLLQLDSDDELELGEISRQQQQQELLSAGEAADQGAAGIGAPLTAAAVDGSTAGAEETSWDVAAAVSAAEAVLRCARGSFCRHFLQGCYRGKAA